MFELFKAFQVINAIKALTGPWQVFHHTGPGEVDEDSDPQFSGKMDLGITSSSYIVKGEWTESGKVHKLRGEAGIVRLKVRETIELDARQVDKDDIYVSSHLDDESDRRLIVEYRFKDGEMFHRVRFKKSAQGV